MYYLLIGIAAIMFGLQFLFNRKYQKNEGNKIDQAVIFSLLTSIVISLIMFIINKGKIEFSVFSGIMAGLCAIVSIAYIYFSAMAFDRVNLSVYSLFSMLGGMILPVIYGVMFYSEDFPPRRILCLVIIIIALFIGTDLKTDKKTIVYCIVVFILNGLVGVISKCHQSSVLSTSSSNFMLIKCLITILICTVFMLVKGIKIRLVSPVKSLFAAISYAFVNGIGNFLVLVALVHVNASVQYPMISGGTIVVSVIISFIYKEKITYKNVLSAALALLATLFIV